MALLRLFILAGLIFLLFYLILGLIKKKELPKDQPVEEVSSSPVDDILIEDPICHKLIPKGQSVRLRNDGRTIHFCSEECCEKYVKQQEEKK